MSNAPEASYLVTVEGQYYGSDQGHKAKKTYKLEVKMTEKMMEKALSVIKNNVLPVMLPKKYPDYKRFRTHVITHVKYLGSESGKITNVNYMGLNQLQEHIVENGLPIDTDLYLTTEDLRRAILLHKESPEDFAQEQKARKENMQEELETQRELMALNAEIEVTKQEIASPTFNPASFTSDGENPHGDENADSEPEEDDL